MEVDPTDDLLEADAYTVVEVSEVVVVRTHSSDLKYWDCCYEPNMGWMGHEDLIVTLAPNISNELVVMVNTKAIEVWKTNYFMLLDYNHVQNDLFMPQQ